VLYPIVSAGPAPATIEYLARIAATPPSGGTGLRAAHTLRAAPCERRSHLAAAGRAREGAAVFDTSDDPEALTHSSSAPPTWSRRGCPLDCLQRVKRRSEDRYPKNTRYALLLSLGEFFHRGDSRIASVALLEQLADWYRHDPSSVVHGAAGWLLRQWRQAEVARQVDHTVVPYAPDREWFTLAITVTSKAPPKPESELAKENAGSKSEPAKPAESRQSKPDETAKPAASSKSAAPAEKTKFEPPAFPLPDQDVLLYVDRISGGRLRHRISQ